MNDVFGIQARGGCDCAGPYAHRLMGIDENRAEVLRSRCVPGFVGLQPGWFRLGFHYLHDQHEVAFITKAVLYVADHAKEFLPWYQFDVRSGSWKYYRPVTNDFEFGIEKAALHLTAKPRMKHLTAKSRRENYNSYFTFANKQLENFKNEMKRTPPPKMDRSKYPEQFEYASEAYYIGENE